MSEVAANLTTGASHDAELAKAAIAQGDEKAVEVNVADDYEASKEFSVSPVDHSSEGESLAADATSSQFGLSKPDESPTVAESTGNPSDYRDMAKEVSPAPQGASNVTDSLVEKAIAKGTPSEG